MKKTFPLIVVFLAAIASGWADAPMPLATVHAVHSLSRAEAEQARPVAFEGTVTFYLARERNLFVQDGKDGIFVKATTTAKLVPGDRVRVKGTTAWGFGTKVFSSDITVLEHGAVPKPVPATFDGLIKGQFDTLLVTARGVVHSADMDKPAGANSPSTATLRILMNGGYVEAQALANDARSLAGLLDSEVDITGVAGGKFDGQLRLTGVFLHVGNLSDVKILKPAAIGPWSLPITPMDKILGAFHVKSSTGRVKVRGSATYYDPGSALVIQNGDESIWVKTLSRAPIKIGDEVEATGFPGVNEGFLVLLESEILDKGISAPISPQPMTWRQLAGSRSIFDLISIQGRVVTEAREASQDEYVLSSDGHMFSVIYPHVTSDDGLTPMKEVPVGARISVTGICATQNSNPFGHNVPFNILLRSPDDISIILMPSPITVRNLATAIIVLLLLILLSGVRAWYVDRSRRAQIAELGYLSLRRAQILEDINNSRPLIEVLERITELASVSLKGAPCWCEMADGIEAGNRPEQLDTPELRIADHVIGSNAKPVHGTLYAAFDARTTPQSDEDRALAMAAELATLAVENSKFHSELLHRSEFDMLTDIQNRFSFEKQLDEQIEHSRRTSGIFGLIYIDLNGFKQVNDVYGHQVGDSFLQHVAERMKQLLRSGDVLARIGGDEFVVLVRVVRNRTEMGHIVSRLARCFDEPICVDDLILPGSASFGIALYPEDASTKDGLLGIADAAMYVEKHTHYRTGQDAGDRREEKLEPETRG